MHVHTAVCAKYAPPANLHVEGRDPGFREAAELHLPRLLVHHHLAILGSAVRIVGVALPDDLERPLGAGQGSVGTGLRSPP